MDVLLNTPSKTVRLDGLQPLQIQLVLLQSRLRAWLAAGCVGVRVTSLLVLDARLRVVPLWCGRRWVVQAAKGVYVAVFEDLRVPASGRQQQPDQQQREQHAPWLFVVASECLSTTVCTAQNPPP